MHLAIPGCASNDTHQSFGQTQINDEPIFNTLDFGSIDSTQTDAAPAIQAAIDAAQAAGGGTVLIPASTTPYVMRTGVSITGDNITIEGTGATLFLADGALNGEIIDVIEVRGTPDRPVRNITLRGLTIDANYWNQPGSYNPRGFDSDYAENLLVDGVTIDRAFVGMTFGKGVHDAEARDCVVTRWYDDAFNASGDGKSASCTDIRFIRCIARDSPNGVFGGLPGTRNNAWEIEDGAQRVTLIDCEVINAGGNGFAVRNHAGEDEVLTSLVQFTRCTATDVAGNGFMARGNPAPNTISNITLEECTTNSAVYLGKDIRDLIVRRCVFKSQAIVGPTNNGIIEDSRIDRLTIWAHDVDGWAPYTPNVTLTNTNLNWPISILGPDERVTVRASHE